MTADVKEPAAAGLNPAAFRVLARLWGGYASASVAMAIALAVLSQHFGHDINMTDRPCLALAGVLVFAGAAFAVSVPLLVKWSDASSINQKQTLLLIIVASGLAARLIMFVSEPMLENDYQRYLWDGGVTAHGYNPYGTSPQAVIETGPAGVLGPLASGAGETLQRIGHKTLTTIYPPVAQGAFAIAHLIAPWSLNAWRSVLLVCDLATLALLVKMLDATVRSRLWAGLYWLNPVVLKESFNSAHMEPILLPLFLLSLYLAWRKRPVLGTVALALAAGVKLWPILLVPVLWRPLLKDWRKLALVVAIFAAFMALWLIPMIFSGPIGNSGLAVYAETWKTNSALSPAVESMAAALLSSAGLSGASGAIASRVLIGLILAGLALVVARRPWDTLGDLLTRASVIVAALVLLSPAQYPWYTLWVAPFLVFVPSRAFLLLTATIPLYYTSFYFAAHDVPEVFTNFVVWVIWVPVWLFAVLNIVRPQRVPAMASPAIST